MKYKSAGLVCECIPSGWRSLLRCNASLVGVCGGGTTVLKVGTKTVWVEWAEKCLAPDFWLLTGCIMAKN